MAIHEAKPQHEALYQELIAVIKKYNLDPPEILAVTANLVGKVLAFQDQRTMTPTQGLKIISANIELGNRQATSELSNTKGIA
jgi:hypothetical protein